ncbi:uncharacterized protein LOC120920123 [Rana temporaria]|uniref:uncharacterized protein LOC120920123 n=1 Tax=Rana temporaria TaxID=8407 RepID=UPI001AAD6EBC|nr:uncharacterized protein LOC120920123 [Rana temporaria]
MIGKKMLHLFLGFLYLQKCILCDRLCGERRTVNGTEGRDVILRVERNGIMGEITWLSAGRHFATTGIGGFIKVRDKRYRGKVYAMADGSLNITGLAGEDQGTYTASTLRNATTKTQLCAQYYDLRVYSCNGSSDTGRIVSPPLSSTGRTTEGDHSLLNFIRLLVAACVFMALCWFVAHYGKCGTRSRDGAATQLPTRNLDFDDGTDGALPTTVYVLAQCNLCNAVGHPYSQCPETMHNKPELMREFFRLDMEDARSSTAGGPVSPSESVPTPNVSVSPSPQSVPIPNVPVFPQSVPTPNVPMSPSVSVSSQSVDLTLTSSLCFLFFFFFFFWSDCLFKIKENCHFNGTMEPRGGRVLLLGLMVLYRWIGVICGARNEETRMVLGPAGGNVTLQLNRDDVEDVSWVYDGDVRVKTKPGEPINFRDPDHKGNMWATEDASLVIMNLSLEDEKVYTASLQLKGTQESYVIRYDLKVYKILSEEDIHLKGNVTNTEPCRVLMTCVVKEPNVTVTWRNGSGLNIPGNVLYIEDVHSSLNITCTAKNPVSNVTKAVNPSEFCRGKTDINERNNHLCVIIVSVILAVTAVGVTFYFLFWRQQRCSGVNHPWQRQWYHTNNLEHRPPM